MKLSPRLISLLIVLAVFFSALLARRLGWLQFMEFRAYDFFIQHQTKAASSDPIVLVEMTENDIHSPTLDYPIYDDKLAELLNILEAQQPAVIGLDIWRDIPVPKNGSHLRQFNDVLLSNGNIIAIFTLGGIAPPDALSPYPDRLGFNDNLVVDYGVEKTMPKVRRCLLFSEAQSGQRLDSLAFRVACIYLSRRGIEPKFDADVVRLGKTQLRALRPNDGAYVNADTAGMQILFDFKCPNEFARYSVGDALAGKIPPGSLRDKIVVIGMNTPSVMDDRVTPILFNHRGIEVQAQAIHQLVRMTLNGDKPLTFWSDWQEDVWMLVWCLAGGAIGFWVRSPWRFVAMILLALAALGGIAWQSFMAGLWIPLMAPVAAFLPAAALVTSYISFSEQRQRSQLMHLFSKQVSPAIAQQIWEQRDEFLAGNRPRSQELIATTLFTDLKGFSTTSEGLEPAQLMDWLNEYMEAMAHPVMANDGVIEKYIGDAIMAVFGVPIPRASREQIERDARNAVHCALAMAQEMERLNAHWKQRGWPECKMRIGIHTGPLVAGSLGSADRQEYTVIGDSVNTASRLESFDKELLADSVCRILVSEATRELLGDKFQTEAVGTMSLKGKADKVMIHQVVARTNREPGG